MYYGQKAVAAIDKRKIHVIYYIQVKKRAYMCVVWEL